MEEEVTEEQFLEALLTLKDNKPTTYWTLTNYLRQQLKDQSELLIYAKGEDIFMLQGTARAYGELVKRLSNPKELLRGLNSRGADGQGAY